MFLNLLPMCDVSFLKLNMILSAVHIKTTAIRLKLSERASFGWMGVKAP